MQKKLLAVFLCIPFVLFSQKSISIIPQPVSVKQTEGSFIFSQNTGLVFDTKDAELQSAAHFFVIQVKNVSGLSLQMNKQTRSSVILKIDPKKDANKEAYQLSVTPSSIKIVANNKAGILYGMQSVLQTLPSIRTNQTLEVPCMEITDQPRFKWRGMHLDVSRHFFSADVIKEYIDLMAMYKMNIFHWHLCDDQGWRIEIKQYPKLTQVGAWRVDRTDKVWGDREPAKENEPVTYGGYYTQQQIKEIIAYAAERNITIVPEIEMPGHSAAALAAYPQFSCSQQPQLVVTGGQYPKGIQSNYCAGNDSAYVFLQNILKEVFMLFPSPYVHIGGDEVDKSDWKKCLKCQNRMKQENLKNENELQSYFIKRMEKFLIANKKKLIGWDEILEGGLAPEATVMSWRGEGGGIEAAKMKHEVVMTPGSPCYFDHYQAGPEGEPVAIGGFNSLKKVYDYNPVPQELSADDAKYVLGAQGNVWTEFISTTEHLEYMVLPRMVALAEVLWTEKENKNWVSFNQRLQYHFRAYQQKGLHYCPGNFKVNINPTSVDGKLLTDLSSEIVNGEIHYSVDGSAPTTQSNRYIQPFVIDSSVTVKAVVVINNKVMGYKPAEQAFSTHKANGCNVNYINPVSKYYTANGANTLTDGVRGTTSPGKFWHGWNAKDLIATVDLKSIQKISSITLGCLQSYRDWIFLPTSVQFEISVDGINFIPVKTIINTISVSEKTALTHDFKATFSATDARFVRVSANTLKACPAGHSGAGQPAWIFADEIIVE